MKKNLFFRIITLIVCLALLMSTASAAWSDNTVQPRYVHIKQSNATLKIDSSGYASCTAMIRLDSSYTADVTMELQRSTNGRTWTPLDLWAASGSTRISLSEGCYVTPGYTYRVHLTATVYTSSGSVFETATANSATVDY